MLDAACQETLDSWCNQPANCPHAATHGALHARLDITGKSGQEAWRCYAAETLTADLRGYAQGTTFCTRNLQLRALWDECTRIGNQPVSVEVSPTGAATSLPPQPSAVSPTRGDPATALFEAWLPGGAAVAGIASW